MRYFFKSILLLLVVILSQVQLFATVYEAETADLYNAVTEIKKTATIW